MLISADLDSDFDLDEDYARGQSLVTYSATLSNQRVVNEDVRFHLIYTARCGTQGIGSTNPEQQELSTDTRVVPAVFHHQIRAELIEIAKGDGAYSMFPRSISIFHS